MAQPTKLQGDLDDSAVEVEVLSAADLADWRRKHPNAEPDLIAELIGAAMTGQDRDTWVRQFWAASRRRFVATMGREPRRNRSAWTTTAGRVKPHDGEGHPLPGKPPNPNLALLVDAVKLLQHEQGWTQYHARRVVAERMVETYPIAAIVRAWKIPTEDCAPESAKMAARDWVMETLKHAMRTTPR